MAHSRIIQLKSERMNDLNSSEIVTSDDYVQNDCFIGPVADYVSDACDRREDFYWLISWLKNVLGEDHERYFSWHYAEVDTNMPEAYIVFHPAFKKAYIQKQYDVFIKQAGVLTLENFISLNYIRQLEDAICDKYSFYIAEDAFNTMPLDTFIRSLTDNEACKYWLWATVDYHY